jgi:hypothetical protein
VTGPRPGEVATPEVLAAWVLALAPAPALPAGPRVVALDGRSGAGKTTLARSVADAVWRHRASAVVVHLDDLYPGWDGLDAAVPLLVEHVLAPLAGPAPIVVPAWDWTRDAPGPARPRPDLGPPRPAVVLVEGAGSGARACVPYLTALVWLEAPEALRKERALARDGADYAPHWDRWAGQERRHAVRERTRERADLVLDATPGPENPIVVRGGRSVASGG